MENYLVLGSLGRKHVAIRVLDEHASAGLTTQTGWVVSAVRVGGFSAQIPAEKTHRERQLLGQPDAHPGSPTGRPRHPRAPRPTQDVAWSHRLLLSARSE